MFSTTKYIFLSSISLIYEILNKSSLLSIIITISYTLFLAEIYSSYKSILNISNYNLFDRIYYILWSKSILYDS